MDLIIGYESALEYWRTVGPRFLRGAKERRAATARARKALREEEKPRLSGGNRRPAGCVLPVNVLVSSALARVQTKSVLSHEWSFLPDRSVIDAGQGFFVSTPEFCFLQMASRLSLARLIQVGCELCGTYAQDKYGPARRREVPLTSVAKLRAFVEAVPGAYGRAKALRALRFVLDGAASPMETVLALLLCLPYRLGGYGIEKPRLNFHVDVPSHQRKLADRRYCECDLCWPEANLVVEYDSKLYHTDPERQESDSRRRGTLVSLGFTVLTVSRMQVMDGGAFNRLAHQVANLTGKRLRYVDPGFTRSHLTLRDELFQDMRSGE
ncbi:endonuclease domain-containing protein [Arabiibacter massiliensis]|uniref:endonuclease domain-containing protein n=1 Tax=Arabiibacter massiliensis TaxID=1870985 RepID=UPI001E3F46DA|nr:endonuclease domain-containing protein [Arabiibacter massiliensis]